MRNSMSSILELERSDLLICFVLLFTGCERVINRRGAGWGDDISSLACRTFFFFVLVRFIAQVRKKGWQRLQPVNYRDSFHLDLEFFFLLLG